MAFHARVAVIGGGIVGCSILYHLVRLGWRDVVLLERTELTSGSTWHAAGGMHTLNGDASVAALQKYTLELYSEIEAGVGTSCGIHRTGCVYLATTQHELDFFLVERAKARTLGIELDFIPLADVSNLNSLVDVRHFRAAMFDPNDGHVDPSSVTHAFAQLARTGGATIHRQCPVRSITQSSTGEWRLETPKGEFVVEHVVNAAGLWAREVASLAGHRVPVVPIEHQYIVTNDIPSLATSSRELATVVDFNGASYVRQEGRGLLLGTYEQLCRHWAVEGTPADFGIELLAPDLERIGPELEIAMQRFPALAEAGIKRVVNGGMMFSPDGNPAIGPVPGLKNFHAAIGCMAGFSQGGGVGIAVASWIVNGDPGMDVYAMDIARFGDFATTEYVMRKSRENYQRRFIIPCPNEELVAARPLRTSALYEPQAERGAVFGSAAGWEVPLWFAGSRASAHERPTFRRSNAFPAVVAECQAVRNAAGLWDASSYCKLEVSGRDASRWLDRVVANRVPEVGRISLCPMLTPRGRILGDVSLLRLEDERFWMIGSPIAEGVYLRWLRSHLSGEDIQVASVSADYAGLAVTGPLSRELLQRCTPAKVTSEGLPFLHVRRLPIGAVEAWVARLSFTGEIGFELYVRPHELRYLHDELLAAGDDLGIRHFGLRALNALRIEKGYGSWGREYSVDCDPFEAGLGHLVQFRQKGDFIGREAASQLASMPLRRRLTLLAIDSNAIDASGGEPLIEGGRAIARLTSASYSPVLGRSLGLAYLPVEGLDKSDLSIEVLGERLRAIILPQPPYDPTGARLRS